MNNKAIFILDTFEKDMIKYVIRMYIDFYNITGDHRYANLADSLITALSDSNINHRELN